jgi:hypothetical protein
LYWLFVLEQELQHRLYRAADPLYDMAWRPGYLADWLTDGATPPGSNIAPFCIVQSTLELQIGKVERLMLGGPAVPGNAMAGWWGSLGRLARRLVRGRGRR